MLGMFRLGGIRTPTRVLLGRGMRPLASAVSATRRKYRSIIIRLGFVSLCLLIRMVPPLRLELRRP